MHYDKTSNVLANGLKLSVFGVSILTISVLVVLGFSLFSSATTESFEAPSNSLQVVAVHEQREWIPELPVRLVIPAIEVDAKVQHVGLSPDDNEEMDVPSNFTDVGWYQHGVRPGMRGSAVIAGHLNGKEVPEAVFYDLHTLQIGDEIVIMSEERIEDIFYVVKIETYAYDAPTDEVFVSTDGKARLNLITCSGEWLPEDSVYNQRTVVFAERFTDVE